MSDRMSDSPTGGLSPLMDFRVRLTAAEKEIERLRHNLKVEMESRDHFWKQVIEKDVIINSLKKRLNDES